MAFQNEHVLEIVSSDATVSQSQIWYTHIYKMGTLM